MTLRSRLRRHLIRGAAGVTMSVAALAAVAPAQAAYTPGVEQFAGAEGCAASVVTPGCTTVPGLGAAGGIARVDDDIYVSQGVADAAAPALLHLRRKASGLALQSCIVAAASQTATQLGCEIVPTLPSQPSRPAVTDNAVYVGGSHIDSSGPRTGVVVAIPRDAATGDVDATGATCRAADVSVVGCGSAGLDRLGTEVRDVVAAPDGTTVTALAGTASEAQLVTYTRDDADGTLAPASCLANVTPSCVLPPAAQRPLLNWASTLVMAPDGQDAYVGSDKGLVHLARNDASGELSIDDCVGDRIGLAGICDSGPGDFIGVTSLSMTNDDQVIAVAYGLDPTNSYAEGWSVVRLLRDGTGTLTEAGCIANVEGDGCGPSSRVVSPTSAMATPDGKNVVVAGHAGLPIVTLIAGGAAGLRQMPGTSGCSITVNPSVDATGCAADLRGFTAREADPQPVRLFVADDEVVASSDASLILLRRGRAPGCLARNATALRPASALPLYCADPNGDAIAYAIGRQPAHGTLEDIEPSTNSVIYTPDDTYEGSDSFTYGAGDGTFTSAAVTYALTLPSGPNTVKPDGQPGNGGGNGGGSSDGGPDGTKDRGGEPASPTPGDAGTRAPAGASGGSTPSPGSATGTGVIDLASVGKQLTVSSKRIVSFKLTCRGVKGAAACKGGLRLGAASRLLVDGKRQVVTFGRKDYVIPAGTTLVVNLRLPAKLAALITKKKPVAATVLAIGTAPSSAKAVQAAVALKR